MKKILIWLFCCLFSEFVSAQTDVTKFMGIPVDGRKQEMVKKLEAKGFELKPGSNDILQGEFNGMQVDLHIVTQKDKVYRIMVVEQNMFDAPEIKTRYNNLCLQFSRNKRYTIFADSIDNYFISDEEDLDYEMQVNGKRYQALFIQMPENIDTTAIARELESELKKEYTEEELKNFSQEQKEQLIIKLTTRAMNYFSKRQVWVSIANLYGKYVLLIYYDNKFNEANGEDL